MTIHALSDSHDLLTGAAQKLNPHQKSLNHVVLIKKKRFLLIYDFMRYKMQMSGFIRA